METYILNICGLQRQLPVCPINENLSIAAFIMFGDVELTKLAAQELLKICPPHNILLTAEAKGIPLCYEMAAQSGGEYVVARKGIKLYMQNSVSVQVKSITTDRVQTLYLDGAK
ncbi:MAG: adenine phosphoribosyltransferase, partial [Oscillospiraceae bacterium]|nr:adenine phosphoribosyltransferase [Oscillospiraceae bacterium]